MKLFILNLHQGKLYRLSELFFLCLQTDMKPAITKKTWEKPSVHALKINKDTFGGKGFGAEGGGGKTIPKKKS